MRHAVLRQAQDEELSFFLTLSLSKGLLAVEQA